MPITLVNRSKAEVAIYIGTEGEEKVIFEAGERKDGIDGSKCLDIENHIFVKSGDLEVFGNPKDDVKEEPKETTAQKKAREKAEAEKAKAGESSQTAQ
ncbi:hypothetical protein VPHD81_0047 [Vibrio phage D81]